MCSKKESYWQVKCLNVFVIDKSDEVADMKKLSTKISLLGLMVILVLGGTYFMNRQAKQARAEELYRHAFRLYEEQIALYITDHFSGVSKVEFSPIHVGTGSWFTVDVIPVVYDNYGNKAYLGRSEVDYSQVGYGLLEGIVALDFDLSGGHVIILHGRDELEVDVSDYQELPDFARLTREDGTDHNIQEFVERGVLKDVIRDGKGSPNVEIVYNLEVRKGDVDEWE